PQLPLSWAAAHDNFRYIPVLSEPRPEDGWQGRTGLVHRAVMEDYPDLSAYQVYACGAPAMIDAARQDFTQVCKLPADEFFADAFTFAADATNAP
ncbi:MAG: CDP-6-deoxy-delta-3,4-glucoseen reductase, partial [Pseudomonadota bacterium]